MRASVMSARSTRSRARVSLGATIATAALLLMAGFSSSCGAAVAQEPKPIAPQVSVVGSGKVATRDVALNDFASVEIGSALKTDITKGAAFSVAVTADDNVLDYVEATRNGQTLTLGMKSGSYTNTTVRVMVVMPDLTRISLSGASKATISGFKPSVLEVRLSGASQLTGRMEGGHLDATIAEASRLELGGSSDSLKLSQSGASQALLGDLAVNSALVSMREASSGTVNVKNRLDADLRSASSLYYVGNPSLGSITSVEASSLRRK